MSAKLHHLQSALACVEVLESRRLLSASPAMHAAGALMIERAVTIAHANIPVLTGAPFVGTASATIGTTDGITVSFTSEGKSGGLAGTITVAAGGQTLVYTLAAP